MLKVKKHFSSFFLLWFVVVSFGICAAVLLASPLGEFIYNLRGESWSLDNDGSLEQALSLLLLVSLFMALGQWFVISTRLKKAHTWIIATLFGFPIGGSVFFFIYAMLNTLFWNAYVSLPDLNWNLYYEIYSLTLTFAAPLIIGLAVGFLQSLSLKRKMSNSIKWSLVTGFGFTIGILPMTLISRFIVREHPLVGVIIVIISAGLAASVTGFFAESLIINPQIKEITQQEVVA